MAGFKRSKLVNEYVIKFPDDPVMEGFEVRCAEVDIGRVLDVVAKVSTLEDVGQLEPGAMPSTEVLEEVGQLSHVIQDVYVTLHEGIISWNLEEDDDTPIEVSIEAVRGLGFQNCFKILMAWTQGAVAVPVPLEPESPSGRPPPELSLATGG